MGIGIIFIMGLVALVYKKNRTTNDGSNIRYQISKD